MFKITKFHQGKRVKFKHKDRSVETVFKKMIEVEEKNH